MPGAPCSPVDDIFLACLLGPKALNLLEQAFAHVQIEDQSGRSHRDGGTRPGCGNARVAKWVNALDGTPVLTNSPHDDRRAARTNVLLAASLETERSPPQSVRIANLSASGALIFGEALPVQDTRIVLVCGIRKIPGHVAWAGEHHAGIAFDNEIDPSEILPKRIQSPLMIIRDERETDFRRPGFRGDQLSAEERQMLEEWKRSETKK